MIPSIEDYIKGLPVANIAQTGMNYALGATGSPRICDFGNNRIAYYDTTNQDLQIYTWNDATGWAQQGNSLNLGDNHIHSLCKLNDTQIAVINSNTGQLKAYDWDGSDLTQAGNTKSGLNTGEDTIGYQYDNQIAFVNEGTFGIMPISWDGTDFTTATKTGLSMSNMQADRIDNTYMMVGDDTLNGIRVFSLSGTYTQDATLNLGTNTGPVAVCLLNSKRVIAAYQNINNGSIRAYDWDAGSLTLTQSGSNYDALTFNGVTRGQPSLAKLTNSTFCFTYRNSGGGAFLIHFST